VKPGVVVELGSGVSTYWLARTIRANGKGCLFSIDHDEGFMAETKSHLEAVNLEKEVNFRLAPLTEGPTWYTQLLLNDINGIDLLVVDGPPIVLGADRGFALTYFADRLNDGATVFFDDTGRVADRESIRRAQRLDDRFDLDFIDSEKGYCVAHFARGGHAKGTFDGSNEK
jgi:predicted O-methyltransferase YrrM